MTQTSAPPTLPNIADIPEAAHYKPMRILEVELGEALLSLSALDEKTGQHYQRIRCVVRLHTQPLGVVDLDVAGRALEPEQYIPAIWNTLHTQINDHLQSDGLPTVSTLETDGLSWSTPPTCIVAREQFLAEAPFVSVIVGTHDRPQQLAFCLPSLLALRYPNYEIIIVDNNPSTTATFDMVRQAQQDAPHLHYLREDRPGISWARNRGIMAAKGEILVFTDDDVRVDQYWLAEMVRTFSSTENVGCVTGVVLPLELETPAQFWFEEFGGFSQVFAQQIIDLDKHRPANPLFPFALGNSGVGASMAFTASAIRGIDGFDPILGGGGPLNNAQDINAFFRVIMAGYKLVYTPSALLYHQHRRDVANLRRQIYNYGKGFTGQLSCVIARRPDLILDLATKVPRGVFRILSGSSEKNNGKSTYFPKELTTLELKGMIYGPVAFARTWWMMRKVGKRLS